MQVLEKILEEIELEKKRLVFYPDCSSAFSAVQIRTIEKIEQIICKYMSIRNHMNDGWIPVEKYGLPKEEGIYDLTIINGYGEYVSVRWEFLSGVHLSGQQHYVDGVHYWADNYQGNPINEFLSERVIAWRKKPEPYYQERIDNYDGE